MGCADQLKARNNKDVQLLQYWLGLVQVHARELLCKYRGGWRDREVGVCQKHHAPNVPTQTLQP